LPYHRFLALVPAGSAALSEEELVAGPVLVSALEHGEGLCVTKLHKLVSGRGGQPRSAAASFHPAASAVGTRDQDIFAYSAGADSLGERLGPLHGQGSKAGAVCATSQEGAAKHLEFFFKELFGKSEMAST
jgi:hypothetical protein